MYYALQSNFLAQIFLTNGRAFNKDLLFWFLTFIKREIETNFIDKISWTHFRPVFPFVTP